MSSVEKIQARQIEVFGRALEIEDWARGKILYETHCALRRPAPFLHFRQLPRSEKDYWIKMAVAAKDMSWPKLGQSLFVDINEQHDSEETNAP